MTDLTIAFDESDGEQKNSLEDSAIPADVREAVMAAKASETFNISNETLDRQVVGDADHYSALIKII